MRLDSVDSTNEQARRLAAEGGAVPVWIWARTQTAGRGRVGRKWVSRQGNLFCTLLMHQATPPRERAQLSFVTALAVARALESLAPVLRPRLKWPNDVLLNGRKVGGVLLESFPGAGQAAFYLAVGVGVNLVSHPDDTAFPATDCACEGAAALTAFTLLGAVAGAFDEGYRAWLADGFAPVRQQWLHRAHGLGQRIRVDLGERVLDGTFEDLSPNGELLLRRPDGKLQPIAAGDVFFRGQG